MSHARLWTRVTSNDNHSMIYDDYSKIYANHSKVMIVAPGSHRRGTWRPIVFAMWC